jgi:hypothetical protein
MHEHLEGRATPEHATAETARPIPSAYLIGAAIALTAGNIAGAFLPHAPAAWAFAHPNTVPAAARVVIALAVPALVLLAGLGAGRLDERNRLARAARSPLPWMAILVALHLAIPNTHPYGDAVRFYRFIPNARGPDANAPLSFEAHRLLAGLFPRDLVFAFTLLGVLGGLLAVPGLFRLARGLFPRDARRRLRAIFLLGMAGSAAWQLFVGYVEHYHVQLALVIWGLAFVVEAECGASDTDRARGGTRSAWRELVRDDLTRGALLLGLAAAWNLSAAWLLPVPVAAALRRHPVARRGRTAAVTAAAYVLPIAATAVVIFLHYGAAAVMESYRGGFHPIARPAAGFLPPSDLLSASHILFLLNEAVLVAPLGLVVLLAMAGSVRSPHRLLAPPLGLAALLAAVFAILWNPRLGWSKDWDLFSWPLFLIQAAALAAALRRESDPPRVRLWLLLAGAAIAHAAIFMISNSALGTPR